MPDFINQQLASEWPDILHECKAVRANKFRIYLSSYEVDFPKCPYVIDIEEYGFFYDKKEERDLDFSIILQIFAKSKFRHTPKK